MPKMGSVVRFSSRILLFRSLTFPFLQPFTLFHSFRTLGMHFKLFFISAVAILAPICAISAPIDAPQLDATARLVRKSLGSVLTAFRLEYHNELPSLAKGWLIIRDPSSPISSNPSQSLGSNPVKPRYKASLIHSEMPNQYCTFPSYPRVPSLSSRQP